MSWQRIVLYGLLLVGLIGARGHLLASMLGGRYRGLDWFSDSLALSAIIVLLKMLDALLRGILSQRMAGYRKADALIASARITLLVCAAFPFLLTTLQIHPQRISTRGTPSEWDLPYEEVTLTSQDHLLRGWYCPQPQPSSAVFVAHGLNANRENFLGPVDLLHALGHAVLIIDFPAHGDSEGRATTLGLQESEDVKAAHDWLAARHPNLPIHALGYSMGASAVIHAASQHGIFEKVAIDSTFSSLEQVAKSTVLRFTGPLSELLWLQGRLWAGLWTGVDLENHRPGEAIARLPPERLLILHGTEDRMIPLEEGRLLHAATQGRARFVTVEGYGHAETLQHPEYARWLDDFFKP